MSIAEVLRWHNLEVDTDCGDGWADVLDRLLTDMEALGWQTALALRIGKRQGTLWVFGDVPPVSAEQHRQLAARMDAARWESLRTCELCGKPGAAGHVFDQLVTLCEAHRAQCLTAFMQ